MPGIVYMFLWVLVRTVFRVGFRMRVSGTENIPNSGGFILASNHRSYYDSILVIGCTWRHMHSFAKAELFRNPLSAALMRHLDTISVRRGVIDRKAMEKATKVINGGNGLVYFPEGTRCLKGRFLPPKPGIGMLTLMAKCPILPVYLHGSNNLLACFIGRDRLSVSYGKLIPPQELPNQKDSYVAIAQQVMASIEALSDVEAKNSY